MVHILKKAFLLVPALAFVVCSHLRPCCDFTVDGRRVSTGCTPEAAQRARDAALAAAEEILPGPASLPKALAHVRFSLRSSAETAPALSDALLRSTPGVIAGDEVYLSGYALGTVADGRQLRLELREYIENTLPTWASSGSISGYIQLRGQYTRAEFEVPPEDMIMLITGLSPVMYTDGEGRVSPV